MSRDLSEDLGAPVEFIGTDLPAALPEEGTALCLSGGGYRAMLFHLGTLWRLNETGYLGKLARISSVSGGSITSAVLGMNWARLEFDAGGRAQAFTSQVVEPVRGLAGKTIDRSAVFGGLLTPGSINDKIVAAYRKYLFGDATLQDLPDEPRFVINATNVQSGALWRFMKPYMRDWRVGEVKRPEVTLALAVAASSACPPLLSPAELELDPASFTPNSGDDLQQVPYTSDVMLTDGGVYDNMGIETAWKRYSTILVSDAGGKMAPDPDPKHDWIGHSVRVLGVIDNQVRSLRKRQVISSFKREERSGAYWSIRSDVKKFKASKPLECPSERTAELAGIATRLKRLDDELQMRLINWGYATCDVALRVHVDTGIPAPEAFPYPGAGV